MAPAEGRGRINAAERRGVRQALAFDIIAMTVIEPRRSLLAQNGDIGVLVSALKVRPQLLQRNRKSPCERPQPTTARPAQWGQPWASTRSWLVVPSASSRRPRLPLLFGQAPVRSSDAPPVIARSAFDSASKASRLWSTLRPQSPKATPKSPQPASNQLLDPDVSLNQTNS